MNVFDVLDEIESYSGRLQKEACLKKHASVPLLKETFIAVDHPYMNYGVTKWDELPHDTKGEIDDDTALRYLLVTLLPQLNARALTGNAARDFLSDFFSKCSFRAQKWCARIVLRNLRVGVQSSTAEKLWKGYIPKFSVALAQVLDVTFKADGTMSPTGLSYPKMAEPKLDGLRCIAMKVGTQVTLRTRAGREIDTLPRIVETLSDHLPEGIVLDCEVLGADWNESQSVVASKKNSKDDSGMFLNVFDCLTLHEWSTETCTTPFKKRSKQAEEIVQKIHEAGGKNIKKVQGVIVDSDKDLFLVYQRALNEGYEGIMIKDLDAGYIFKRSKTLLKLKPVATYEGVVVGTYSGRENTRLNDVVGGLEVKLPNGVVTRVGSGFSDVQRQEMADDAESVIGRIAECEAQPPLTEEGRMRFPVFVRWRDPDDVAQEVRDLLD